jgi:formyltetrahydrofolate deformylase
MKKSATTNHVLLFSCPDEKGLIHRITGILLQHGLNITENHEFVDRNASSFFMRTELTGNFPADSLLSELKKELPPASKIELHPQTPKRLVLLATKEPHCLGDLLLRHSANELNAEIVAVISQYDSLQKLVSRFDIPFHHVPASVPASGDQREEHERALLQVIQGYKPDYLVLAKYMRILTPWFVQQFENRIINIHHSFLPAFIGANPYAQAYERGVKIIGATSHFVNQDLDEGPIITQSVISIDHTQDASALARAGRDVERMVLARALNLVLENRVIVQGRRTLVFE